MSTSGARARPVVRRPVAPSPAVNVLIGVDPVLCRPVHDVEGLRAHHGIRRAVFVQEQGVFPESDVDALSLIHI